MKVFAPEDFGYRKVFIERPLHLDMDLSQTEPGHFRNASDLDRYFLRMAQAVGEDCEQRLEEIKAEVIAHVEKAEGLTLLRADENAAKAEVTAAEKRCKRILKTLRDATEWMVQSVFFLPIQMCYLFPPFAKGGLGGIFF